MPPGSLPRRRTPCTPAAEIPALVDCIGKLDDAPGEADIAVLRSWCLGNARSVRRKSLGPWGVGPTVLQWVLLTIAGGVVGNFAYDGVKALLKAVAAKWKTEDDPVKWLEMLCSDKEWEEVRILRHPGTQPSIYIEKRYAEYVEAKLVVLQAEAAGLFEGEPEPRRKDARFVPSGKKEFVRPPPPRVPAAKPSKARPKRSKK